MIFDDKKFSAARRASGLTLDDAANSCGITRQTYVLREKQPTELRLNELHGLYSALDENGRGLLKDAVNGIFFD